MTQTVEFLTDDEIAGLPSIAHHVGVDTFPGAALMMAHRGLLAEREARLKAEIETARKAARAVCYLCRVGYHLGSKCGAEAIFAAFPHALPVTEEGE